MLLHNPKCRLTCQLRKSPMIFYFMYFMDAFHCMHIKIFKVEHICTAFVAFFVNYIVEEASGDFGF